MRFVLARRLLTAGLFGMLGSVVLLIAWNRTTASPGPSSVETEEWVLATVLLAGSALGVWSAWSRRSEHLLGALALVAAGWALHSWWRLATRPPELRAVTFGGDVVQSALAFFLLANATMWAAGMISLRIPRTFTSSPPR